MQIKVNNLKKYFNRTKAIDDISFEFSSGEIVGFIGPNGAGKTTAMRIMATIDSPTDGEIYFDNISAVQYPEKVRKIVGFMPDFLPSYRDMSVDDYIDFFARAFSLKSDMRRKVVDSIESFTNLIDIKDKSLDSLSKGMKQRVSLARALIHDPEVLILDEPAAGLDPRARIELRELLKALSSRGKAILVSSHILTELSEICDKAVIIENGKLLFAGNIREIDGNKKERHTYLFRPLKKNSNVLKDFLLQMPGVSDARISDSGVEADIEGIEEVSNIISMLVNAEISLIEVKQIKTDLEDIFMNVTDGVKSL